MNERGGKIAITMLGIDTSDLPKSCTAQTLVEWLSKLSFNLRMKMNSEENANKKIEEFDSHVSNFDYFFSSDWKPDIISLTALAEIAGYNETTFREILLCLATPKVIRRNIIFDFENKKINGNESLEGRTEIANYLFDKLSCPLERRDLDVKENVEWLKNKSNNHPFVGIILRLLEKSEEDKNGRPY